MVSVRNSFIPDTADHSIGDENGQPAVSFGHFKGIGTVKAFFPFLAGALTAEEAMAMICVPTKNELLVQISSELTLETSGAQS